MADNTNNLSKTRQERKFSERLKILAITIVIVILYNILDPKQILLEQLEVILDKFFVVWMKFTFLVQRDWLIYLAGLIFVWIITILLQKLFVSIDVPENTNHDSLEPDFGGKWGGRISGNLIVIFAGIRSFLVIAIVIYLVFIAILLNPVGKLLTNFNINLYKDLLLALNCIFGLACFAGIWFIASTIESYFSKESRAHRERPDFFKEMQETLQSILIPIGFEEKTNPTGMAQGVTFSRDQLIVNLWYDYRDQIYFVDASSGYSLEEREKGIEVIMAKSKAGEKVDQMEFAQINSKDFYVEGTILNAESFKNNAVSKLTWWLAEHNR